MKNEPLLINLDTSSYLQVCLTDENGSDLSIPLKDIVPTLMKYVNAHGGEGKLQILMYYKDKEGVIKPISEDMVKTKHDYMTENEMYHLVREIHKQDTLTSGENITDDLTHSLWCLKCGMTKITNNGKKAFFIQNGESVCKKHYKKL